MIVGITRLSLALPGNDSLKGKRSVVRKLLDRVRARFHVAAAEVDEHDVHQRATLGFCTIGVDGRKIAGVLERVVAFVDGAGLAQIVSVETEVASYSDLFEGGEVTTFADKFGLDEEFTEETFARPPPQEAPRARKVALRPGSLGFGSRGGDEDEDED